MDLMLIVLPTVVRPHIVHIWIDLLHEVRSISKNVLGILGIWQSNHCWLFGFGFQVPKWTHISHYMGGGHEMISFQFIFGWISKERPWIKICDTKCFADKKKTWRNSVFNVKCKAGAAEWKVITLKLPNGISLLPIIVRRMYFTEAGTLNDRFYLK